MPTIEISKKDLQNLVRRKFSLEKASEWVKASFSPKGNLLTVELRDVNRPDLWSVEGIAREIKTRLGIDVHYSVKQGNYVVKVSNKVKDVRPKIVAAVVKDLKFDEEAIKQLIQLQEKLAELFGLKRREVAIGVYDFDKIEWPITYTTAKPELRFVPLGFKKELSLKEILQRHEKGIAYGHLIKEAKEWPILIDKSKNVLSMPPIINSEYSGKVTTETKNVFVEVTGFNDRFILHALNIMVMALADRGGKVETVKIKQGFKTKTTPEFREKKLRANIGELKSILGLEINQKQLLSLIQKTGYKIKKQQQQIVEVIVPFWRQDVMSARDIAEDIAISFGYNNFKALPLEVISEGNLTKRTEFKKKISQFLVGFGAQEVATFILTNKKTLFKKMMLKQEDVVEIKNPISANYSCLRSWILPCLLEFLSANKNARFPQKIFEISTTESIDNGRIEEKEKLCFVISASDVTFTNIKQVLDFFMSWLNLSYTLEAIRHPSFTEGRVGKIIVKKEIRKERKKQENIELGIIGEIHPSILEKFNLVMPVAAFEIDLGELLKIKEDK